MRLVPLRLHTGWLMAAVLLLPAPVRADGAAVLIQNGTQGVVQVVRPLDGGQEKVVNELAPSASVRVNTSAGTKYVVRDKATGKVIQEVTAAAGEQTVKVGDPTQNPNALKLTITKPLDFAVEYALVNENGQQVVGWTTLRTGLSGGGGDAPWKRNPYGMMAQPYADHQWVVRNAATLELLAVLPAGEKPQVVTVKPNPPVPGTGTGSAVTRAEVDEVLAFHNAKRAEIEGGEKLPPVRWSVELARFAQAYADRLAQTGQFAHNVTAARDNLLAENMYHGVPANGDSRVKAALDNWYSEKGRPEVNGANSGHYLNMVARNDIEIGVGVGVYQAGPHKGHTFVVADYGGGLRVWTGDLSAKR